MTKYEIKPRAIKVLKKSRKKIYAVVNLSCKKFDERFKKVYNMYTRKRYYRATLFNIPLR